MTYPIYAGALSALLTAVVGAMPGTSRAADADYPSRPIRVVVPFPAGAGADSNARLIGQKMAELLKQPVIVDNRPGANGMIGTEAVAKAAPDGYTMLFTDRGALGINPSLYKKLPYDPNKDFDYVGIAVWGPYILVANPKTPYTTLAGLSDFAKKNPGKINYASFGNGSMTQIGTEMLSSALGIQMTHVPYKGGAPALTAAMAGEVDIALITIGPALGGLKEGRVKPLFVGTTTRLSILPDVPTAREAGVDPEAIPKTYFGFALPAGTPPAIVKTLSEAARKAVSTPDVSARLINAGFEPATVSPQEMKAVVGRDVADFHKITTRLGIQPE